MITFATEYDDTNIFAKILRGELPNITVYEDSEVLSFMDIMPQRVGHTLVVPKHPAVTLLDLPSEQFTSLMNVTQRVAAAVQKATSAAGFTLLQLNGSAAGQTVPHLHFHIIPGSIINGEPHAAKMGDQDELAKIAERIKNHL